MTRETLTVLIVNYNTSDFVELSLYALKKLTKNKYKVLICDNGSKKHDKTKLKRICDKYRNVNLFFRQQTGSCGIGHGEALNILTRKINTKYGVFLDADATFLKKKWDEILIKQLNDKTKIIGAPPVKNPIKSTDFPSLYVTFFNTNALKSLKIDMRPKDYRIGLDTGWEMREKFIKSNYKHKLLEVKNTREFKDGPFRDVICGEYYLKGYRNIFASHFGRGSTLGTAKYKNWNIFLSLPGIKHIAREIRGRREKNKWLLICKKIISGEIKNEKRQ